jgi:ATP-dependent helicase HrpA
VLKLRQQIAQRIGAFVPAPAPAARPKTFTDFGQLGRAPAATLAQPGPLVRNLMALVPPRFLEQIPFDRLSHLPRYLKALLVRAERAAVNPAKDQERAQRLAPYVDALNGFQEGSGAKLTPRKTALIEEFRWMIEEFRVSLFAQELGTAVPVSAKRLDEILGHIRQA